MKEQNIYSKSHVSSSEVSQFFSSQGLSYIPKIIELLDRNPYSETYGCFDRQFWHYRTSDFPSGMYQEYVLPLALAYQYPFQNNPFYQQPRVKEWVLCGMDFARKSAHKDGSCDDYYPFEKAMGAVAFSLYAASEAYLLLNLKDPVQLNFLIKRAEWLKTHNETGRLSNHHALAALCFQNLFLITEDERFKKAAEKKINELLSWQSEEGWFPEYEGCDLGYLSICVDFLAKYYQKSNNKKVIEPLKKAIQFMNYFSHPDGSFGGEYGSRNTFHFFPHGLEVLGKEIPEGLNLVDAHFKAASSGKRAYTDDDRIFGHLVYNYLQTSIDFNQERNPETEIYSEGSHYFKEAGLYVQKQKNSFCVIGLNKGGVFKYFKEEELKASDTGVILKTDKNEILVSQMVYKAKPKIENETISVEGDFRLRKSPLLETPKFILFRIFMLTFGRVSRNFVRWLLQRKIIYSKKKAGVRFVREFKFNEGLEVMNKIKITDPNIRIQSIASTSDLTSIYVATSQPYQSGSLIPWKNLDELVGELNQKRECSWVDRL